MLKQIKLSSYTAVFLFTDCFENIWVVAHFDENIGSSCLKTCKLRYVISVAFCSTYELNCIVENVSRELNPPTITKKNILNF